MQKVLATLVAAMWAAVLLGGAFRPHPSAGQGKPQPLAGAPAPALTVSSWEGQPVTLESYKGKAVMLNFWASWCGPCRMEMPEIERLAADLPAGTALLTVNVTAQESSPDAVQEFLRRSGYTFPVVLDPHARGETAYRVLSLPTSFFISPDGVITARINGPLSHRAMVDYLKAAGR